MWKYKEVMETINHSGMFIMFTGCAVVKETYVPMGVPNACRIFGGKYSFIQDLCRMINRGYKIFCFYKYCG